MCAVLAAQPPGPPDRPDRPARVHDLDRRRIERALAKRARYRYVQPSVQRGADSSWVVHSPCCSRNVDPTGGVIPIAWLVPHDGGWTLHAHDHSQGRWVAHQVSRQLTDLLDELCADPLRVFWP